MFTFLTLFASLAACYASHLPLSYSTVSLHPIHVVKEWKAPAEWKAPVQEWKAQEEWKAPVVEWKAPVVEWKAPVQEWKAQEEWKAPDVEWKAPVQEWKAQEEWKAPVQEWKAQEEWKAPVVEWKEPETPANYEFKYEVHDEHTGDIKSQSETATNGAVKGQYSLIDSDGYKRIVDYTADDHNGFLATVKREPTHFKVPIPAPKIIAHAPIVASHEQHWW